MGEARRAWRVREFYTKNSSKDNIQMCIITSIIWVQYMYWELWSAKSHVSISTFRTVVASLPGLTMSDRPTGPFGIDALNFSFTLFVLLVLFVLYLLLPRGLRVQYFKAYPKRYAWSARSRARRTGRSILQVSVNWFDSQSFT